MSKIVTGIILMVMIALISLTEAIGKMRYEACDRLEEVLTLIAKNDQNEPQIKITKEGEYWFLVPRNNISESIALHPLQNKTRIMTDVPENALLSLSGNLWEDYALRAIYKNYTSHGEYSRYTHIAIWDMGIFFALPLDGGVCTQIKLEWQPIDPRFR